MSKRELKNANITHVSYVDKGANQKKFFLTKNADAQAPTFEKQVRVLTKNEDEQMLVYGVVYEPDVVDAHGDFMQAEEIEKSAHSFMKQFRNIDKQHDFEAGAGEVVESYVAPTDIQIGEETIVKGSWVLVTKATEEVWEAIKKGDITGYSMAGTAEVLEVEKAEDTQMKSLFKQLKDFFLGIEKSEEVVEKNEEVIDMNKEELQALLKEEFAPLQERLEALEKSAEQTEEVVEKTEEEIKAEAEQVETQKKEEQAELVKALKLVMKEELAPLQERLETVEKARGITKSAEHIVDGEEVKKEEGSVFKSLFSQQF